MERQKKERVALPIPPFCATHVLTTYGMAHTTPAPANPDNSFTCLWYPHVCARDAAGGTWNPLGKLQFYQRLFASAEASHLKALRPSSPICKSWGKACLLLSAVELF